MGIVPNHTLEALRWSILKILKYYNQPRIVSTRMKLTQSLDYFTVLESFPSTSCCSQKFRKIRYKKIDWLDVWGMFTLGGRLGEKGLQFKVAVGH